MMEDSKDVSGQSDDGDFLANGLASTSAAGAGPAYPWLSAYPVGVNWSAALDLLTLPALLDQARSKHGKASCTYFLGKSLTYEQIGRQVDLVAKGMQKLGVGKGVNVGLMFPNCPAYVIFYYAILKAGGTVVNFNPLYTEEELAGQVKDSQITLLATLDLRVLFSKTEALLASGELKRAVICSFADMLPTVKSLLFKILKRRDWAQWGRSPQRSKIIPYAEVVANDGRPEPVALDLSNDVAVLQYTGGTTGSPKGAMLTHANLSANVAMMRAWALNCAEGGERVMGVLPFFHVFGMTTVMNFAISIGAEMVLMPRFEILQALKLIDATKPTVMPGVPTLFNAMMHHPKLKKYDLSSLKFCISGGAALPIEVKRGFEKLSGCKLVEGYGLSETAPVATCNPIMGDIREGSIGLPLPRTILSIRSLADPRTECPLGESGEICIAGPQVMKGYWRRPEETADAFVGKYFRTGDVAYMDEEGYAYIVDRIKDIVICSGFNVYPRRIEEAIYEFPAVEEVTVLGAPDPYRGETPIAFVKLRAGESATEADIFAFLKPKLSKIEMPSAIEFRESLPKTLIGKLSKKELRLELLKKHPNKPYT
jgi:long-chain acyl-CoA synthetase